MAKGYKTGYRKQNSGGGTDLGGLYELRVYQKQSQFLKSQNDVLSFPQRQESGVFDGPGFRIECGMTGRKDDEVIMQNKANSCVSPPGTPDSQERTFPFWLRARAKPKATLCQVVANFKNRANF